MISPLLLEAQIAPPAGGGSFGLADTTRLENPFQAPMWLDEIRIRLPGASGGVSAAAWSTLALELKLGDISLTKGFVPIGLFGKTLSDSLSTGSTTGMALLTWKLPKPLFIPARELLRPTLYCSPFSGAPTKTVTIIYCCRPLPQGTPTPTTLQIPWVTYYTPPTLTFPSPTDTTNQSTPADLYNPWDEELHVQRFVGRTMPQNNSVDLTNLMGVESAIVDTATGLLTCGTMVSAQDSFNNILIRDPTPFGHVFDYLDRAWTVNCVLPPKGFYLFTIDRFWNAADCEGVITVGIGMVGWREVTATRRPPGVGVPLPPMTGRR